MQSNGKATASMTLGIIGLIFWLIPLFGAPITIVGLVLGVKAQGIEKSTKGTAGIVMCIIGLVLTIINAAIGAYMGASGVL